MEIAVWMSYDLSAAGDYEGLYTWLAERDAKDCGGNLAFFRFDCDDPAAIRDEMLQSVRQTCKLTRKDRLYAVCQRPETGKPSGGFIFGSRSARPAWIDYGMYAPTCFDE